jgi:cytochrome c peroxidase
MSRKKLYFVSILTAYLLSSCNLKDDEPVFNSLDKELEDKLTASSGGKGKDYYIMPEANDYAKIPQDPKNPITSAKVDLGRFLFHETGLGQNPTKNLGLQTYSCASCHHVKAGFQACVPQGIGEGGSGFGVQGEQRVILAGYTAKEIDVQPIRTPSALNIAYQTNILWNGQFGGTHLNVGTQANWTKGTPKETNNLGFAGVETQAIAGRDVHRLVLDRIFMSKFSTYQSIYERAYGKDSYLDDKELRLNGALAIAAYERTLLANQAPFQQWLKGNYNALTDTEKKGAVVFFGKGECATCHNGPSLANMEFHAIGMKDLKNGKMGNNIVSNVSDSNAEHKGRAGFTGKDEDMYKFKVPQLYNLKSSPFYGHGASFSSIENVIRYKNGGKAENTNVPQTRLSDKFKPLNLTESDIVALEVFIRNGLHDANLQRYVPKKLPSGLAFPNNDPKSRIDLGF